MTCIPACTAIYNYISSLCIILHVLCSYINCMNPLSKAYSLQSEALMFQLRTNLAHQAIHIDLLRLTVALTLQ